MPTSSQEYLDQIGAYNPGDAPNMIEQTIKDAYSGPVKQLIRRGGKLRESAYPAFFNAFGGIGTGAGDMSPAAALGAAMEQGESAMSPYRNNLAIRDYYGTLVNDMVGKGMQSYQMGYNSLRDMYGLQYQREQDAARAAAAARARSGYGSGGGGFDWGAFMNSLRRGEKPQDPIGMGQAGVEGGLANIIGDYSPGYNAGQIVGSGVPVTMGAAQGGLGAMLGGGYGQY